MNRRTSVEFLNVGILQRVAVYRLNLQFLELFCPKYFSTCANWEHITSKTSNIWDDIFLHFRDICIQDRDGAAAYIAGHERPND